ISNNEVPFLRILRLVHRDERSAEPVAGERGDRPLETVVRHDGDALSGRDAEGYEPGAEALDERPELSVRRPDPATRPLGAEEIARAVGLDARVADFDQRFVARLERHCAKTKPV